MFYRASLGKEVRHSLYLAHPGDEWWSGFNDLDSQPLLPTWKPLTIATEQDGLLPDWFSSGTKAIVSRAVRATCEEMQVAAEFLPVMILHMGKLIKDEFAVLHPLERIDCIDVNNSQFEMYGTPPNFTIKRYRRLVFIDEAVADKHLFRPKHDPAIYVSLLFRNRIESRKLCVGFEPLPGHGESAALYLSNASSEVTGKSE